MPFTISVLRAAAFLVFLSQAWLHVFWDAPFRALLWNQDLMEPWVERILDQGWEEYAACSDRPIQNVIRGFGVFYAACAILCWTARRGRRWQLAALVAGGLALAFLAFLKFLDHNQQTPQLIEYTAQWATPLFLAVALARGDRPRPDPGLVIAMKVAVAFTFAGHGVYAAGLLPVPGEYMFMTMQCLRVTEEAAGLLLRVAGILDFVVAAAIFVPLLSKYALWYAAAWGALTSLARVVSHLTPAENAYGIDPWLAESLTRAPHALLPLALLAGAMKRLKPDPMPDSPPPVAHEQP
ncbi:MAG: hypothetical protein HKN82_07130 [Akkermansiaceae bacterium]|nr:hypothetical protein [Akkermansiaceae bacterium]